MFARTGSGLGTFMRIGRAGRWGILMANPVFDAVAAWCAEVLELPCGTEAEKREALRRGVELGVIPPIHPEDRYFYLPGDPNAGEWSPEFWSRPDERLVRRRGGERPLDSGGC